jgi:hypothetical protein
VVLATDNVSGMLFQSNHRLATRMQRRLHGRALDIHIRPLNEDKAIQSAVDLLGELFVFSASVLDLHALSEINVHMEQLKIQQLYNLISAVIFVLILYTYNMILTCLF